MQTNCVHQLGKSAMLVLKECRNVNHSVKKVSLRNITQLHGYIKINISSGYYYNRIDGYAVVKVPLQG